MPPPTPAFPERTAEDLFRPFNAAAAPELADLLAFLVERHPLTLAAVADVDRSLIWAMMERSPLENLAANFQHARGIERLRAAARRAREG